MSLHSKTKGWTPTGRGMACFSMWDILALSMERASEAGSTRVGSSHVEPWARSSPTSGFYSPSCESGRNKGVLPWFLPSRSCPYWLILSVSFLGGDGWEGGLSASVLPPLLPLGTQPLTEATEGWVPSCDTPGSELEKFIEIHPDSQRAQIWL